MVRILILGPNRWPSDTADKEAGLRIRRDLVKDNSDLDAEWIIMEDDKTPGDPVKKFLRLATDPKTTHIFLIWPRDCKMVGTEDEFVMWQAIKELTGKAPECYLFHQAGVLDIKVADGEQDVAMRDPQGKSPYLKNILAKGVFEQEWTDADDLRRQFREVLKGDLGVTPNAGPSIVAKKGKPKGALAP